MKIAAIKNNCLKANSFPLHFFFHYLCSESLVLYTQSSVFLYLGLKNLIKLVHDFIGHWSISLWFFFLTRIAEYPKHRYKNAMFQKWILLGGSERYAGSDIEKKWMKWHVMELTELEWRQEGSERLRESGGTNKLSYLWGGGTGLLVLTVRDTKKDSRKFFEKSYLFYLTFQKWNYLELAKVRWYNMRLGD